MENSSNSSKKHFILVHGLTHGAWSWYKVVTMLQSAGHRVTSLDLAASGVHPARIDEVDSFEDYSRPLLDAVAAAPDDDRLVLVGHSQGGISLALAMERFPRKIAVAVFAAAGMPCVGKHLGVTTEEFLRRSTPEFLTDCKNLAVNNRQGPGVAFLLGPNFLEHKYYQQSPPEDLMLAKMLVRPGNLFIDDPLMKDDKFLTDDHYGSVKRVYVIAKADISSTEDLQRWMIELSPSTEVEEIAGADHAIMNSKPRELCDVLVKILKEKSPDHGFMDSKSQISKNPKNPVETFLLGPNCMSRMLYQLSPPEDLTLATMLVRPAQWFIDDVMMKETILTEEKYGAVSRVFVVAENDNLWPAEAQRQVAKLSPGTVVRSIEGADHMPMLSKPRELSELLMEIASKYYN